MKYWTSSSNRQGPAKHNGVDDIEGSTFLSTQSAAQLKACLAAGFPFVFGFQVYGSFESDAVAKSGIVQMLSDNAVMAIGYDDARKAFLIRNSWGADWGAQW